MSNDTPNPAIPAIPAPVPDPQALANVCLALKQAVDSLAGRLNPNDQAVTRGTFQQVNSQTTINNTIIQNNLVTATETASFAVSSAAQVYFCDTTSGPITATMPSAPALGDTYEIADSTGYAGTNNITIAGNGYNIQGAASMVLRVAYGFVKLRFTGAQWIQAQ